MTLYYLFIVLFTENRGITEKSVTSPETHFFQVTSVRGMHGLKQ